MACLSAGQRAPDAIPQITEIVTTDTGAACPENRLPNMTVLSVAPVFGEAIRRNVLRESIGDLFAFAEDAGKP